MILLNVYCLLLLAQCKTFNELFNIIGGITSDKASGHVESTRNNKITLLTEEVFVHGDFITDQDKGVKSSSSVNHNQVIVDIGDLESQNEAGTLKLVLYRRRNPFLAFIIGHRKMSDQLITWKYDDDEDRQETCFRVKPVAYNRIKKLLNSVKSVLQKTLQKFKIGWNIPDKKSEEDKEGDAELEKGMKDKKLYRCRFDMSGFKRIQEGRYFFKIRRKSNDEYIGQSSDFYIINARKKHVDPKSSILKSVAVDAKHFFFQFKRKPDRDEKLYYTIYQYNLKSNVHTPLYRHLIDSRFVFTKEKHMDSEYTYKIKIKNAEMIDYEDEYVQLVLKGEMYSPLNNTYAQLDLVKIYCCGEKHFLTSTTRLFRVYFSVV